MTVKEQLLLTAEVCACVCVLEAEEKEEESCRGVAEKAAVQSPDTKTVCFLHSHIRTNIPQNHDPFKNDLLYPDKDLVIKRALPEGASLT